MLLKMAGVRQQKIASREFRRRIALADVIRNQEIRNL